MTLFAKPPCQGSDTSMSRHTVSIPGQPYILTASGHYNSLEDPNKKFTDLIDSTVGNMHVMSVNIPPKVFNLNKLVEFYASKNKLCGNVEGIILRRPKFLLLHF